MNFEFDKILLAIKMRAKETIISRNKLLFAVLASLVIGFGCGIWFERSAAWHDEEEWMQIAQEACDARIKTIKFACRK